jgi:hypothetical protein
MIRKEGDINDQVFHVGSCKNVRQYIKDPHCVEFHCNIHNIKDCTNCSNFLLNSQNKRFHNMRHYKYHYKNSDENIKECKKKCTNGFIYDYIHSSKESPDFKTITEIDKIKDKVEFTKDKLIRFHQQITSNLLYENTAPRPKTVVHWGQLKMFLVTFIFLLKAADNKETRINVIYPGSARGDNIVLLYDMFPNIYWYLIDPNPFDDRLKKLERIVDIKNEYFTDELAKYYSETIDKQYTLLFISDIRTGTDDISVLQDQDSNIRWHKILKPKYSYLKFRCPYDSPNPYNYYKGKLYIQPFAPSSTTETRLLLKTILKEKQYDIHKYQGDFVYFNRIIRSSFYNNGINDGYFDHCYDCTYFYKLMKKYLKKTKSNKDPISLMHDITTTISKRTIDKIRYMNSYIRNNMNKEFKKMRK